MNPRPGRPPDVERSAVDDMRAVFEAQRSACRQYGAPSVEARRRALDRLERVIVRNREEFAAAIAADFGTRASLETHLFEILPTLNALRHTRRHLSRWMKPERRRVSWMFAPGKAWVMYQPLGVVGIVAPWNYPLLLMLVPLVNALGGGNRVLLKPSELTPRFNAALERRMGEMFPREEVAIVVGGPDVGEAFCRLPFDHLLFTGSARVGRKVMAAAAENLTPVTLELGGKSPIVVCDDYEHDRAARAIVFGKFSNAGQTCIAPDYALAPRPHVDALAAAIMDRARRVYPSIAHNPDYASIITRAHLERLERAVEEVDRAGSRVFRHEDEGARAARKIGPTVVIAPPDDSALMSEEIFGPVLPIVPYDSVDEAIAFINAREKPLALYCLTHGRRRRNRILHATLSGDVTLNGTLLHFGQDNLPFGGVGASGIGAYHGRDGFRRFSHARGVHQIRGLNAIDFLSPPFTARLEGIVRLLTGRREHK